MPMFDPPYGLWSIWMDLSLLQRAIVFLLGALTIYSLSSAVTTMLRLRRTRALPVGDIAVARSSVAMLCRQCAGVRQGITASFYLFSLVLFLGLQAVGQVVGDGNHSLGSVALRNFIVDCAFAANVFFIFLVLHLVQWVVCRQLNSCLEYLSRPS